jgi:hypothetical protein
VRRVLLLALALPLGVATARADPTTDPRAPYERLIQGIDGAAVTWADQNAATVSLRDPGGRHLSDLHLSTRWGTSPTPQFQTASYYVTIHADAETPEALPPAVNVARVIAERDRGGTTPRHPPVPDRFPQEMMVGVLVAAAMALATGLLRRAPISFEFRPSHLVQGLIQATLLAYWGLYWPGVSARVPSILLQIAFAYAVDALVMLARFRRWKVSFGPLPIVLSANLFAWFSPIGALVCVAVAVASRALIRRQGRAVFNPSALGLSFAGLLSLTTPWVALGGTFHTMRMAPNIAELLIFLALLPQIRFRIVLASVGVVLGQMVFDNDVGHLATAPFLLMFALFVTDPTTMPTTPVGRIVFGFFIGATIPLTAALLRAYGFPDDLQKVFPVPLANLMVPWFDRLGTRFAAATDRAFNPRWNFAHVAVWLALIVPSMVRLKPQQFQADLHWTYRTSTIVRDEDDVPRCEHNPVFCRPFSFLGEARLLASRAVKAPAPTQPPSPGLSQIR